MRPFLLSLAVLIATVCTPAHAAPLSFIGRQLLNVLTLDFDLPNEGAVYISSAAEKVNCWPTAVTFDGVNPPFQLDAIAALVSNESTTTGEQVVLERLGNFTASAKVRWNVTLPVNTTFVLRIQDAVGNVRYSAAKTVEVGTKDARSCYSTKKTTSEPPGSTVFGAIFITCIAVGVCCVAFSFWRNVRLLRLDLRRRERRRRRV
ncbi:hypothetical protein JCM6882_002812 [Rhodosporidiobolus microsporus]